MKNKSKQHYQLPNEMYDITPKDQLIYLCIKFFDGKNGCYPSLQKIAEKAGASVPTVRSSIKRLEDRDYIKVTKIGRGFKYIFNKYNKFEPFSPEFINRQDLSFLTKSYLVASQQYMFKDIEGFGKISYSNRELANKINMPESSIRKCNRELIKGKFLEVLQNDSIDKETGCKTDTKVYNLKELGQDIIWTLIDHEQRITKNTEDISELKTIISNLSRELEENKKLLNKFSKENSELKQPKEEEFIL